MLKTISRILKWSSDYKRRMYLGFVCSFFMSWAVAAPTMLAAWALGQVISSHWNNLLIPTDLVWKTALLTAIFILLRFLLSYAKAVLQESIGHEVSATERIQLGNILKRVSLGYFAKNQVGDILAAVTTELSALELYSMKMIDAVVNGYLNLLVIVLCLLRFSPPAAALAVIGAAGSAIALRGIRSRSKKNAPAAHKAVEALSGAVIEYIQGLPVVKSFGQEGASIARFRKSCQDLKTCNINIEYGFTPFNCLHLFILKAASAGLILICCLGTLDGTMSLPVFVMFLLFSFSLFDSVEKINDAAHLLGVIDSAMNKLEALKNTDYIDENGITAIPDNCSICFEDVSFGYDRQTVLKHVSFTIPEHTTTAIVGPSGSGKTTICNLIARFYDVSAGCIRLGNRDIREFTCDSLLKNISMVFQNVYLFRDTIRNNIKFGQPDATDTEIIAAAQAACCHDFITRLPDGYDTIVGEGGSSLSGGEKQRISIARAMLKNAPVIILDEATASIDPENEHLIQEALSALTRGKTIITIAHRLTTIEHADQILVVDGGRIVQQGRHSQLAEQPGIYQNFIRIREKAEGWRIEA